MYEKEFRDSILEISKLLSYMRRKKKKIRYRNVGLVKLNYILFSTIVNLQGNRCTIVGFEHINILHFCVVQNLHFRKTNS